MSSHSAHPVRRSVVYDTAPAADRPAREVDALGFRDVRRDTRRDVEAALDALP
jgi:hypothetical protein